MSAQTQTLTKLKEHGGKWQIVPDSKYLLVQMGSAHLACTHASLVLTKTQGTQWQKRVTDEVNNSMELHFCQLHWACTCENSSTCCLSGKYGCAYYYSVQSGQKKGVIFFFRCEIFFLHALKFQKNLSQISSKMSKNG